MKNVQVFTTGESEYCEINAELVLYKVESNCLYIKTKDEDKSVWEHMFPLWNVRMVRISHV